MRTIAGLVVMLVAFQLTANAQARHNHYLTYYNHDKMEPDSVVYNLTPDMVSCMEKPPKRKDKFVSKGILSSRAIHKT